MRIAIGVGGEVTGTPMSPQDIVDDVVRAEAEGFGSAWSAHFSRGVDALDILAVAGVRGPGHGAAARHGACLWGSRWARRAAQ